MKQRTIIVVGGRPDDVPDYLRQVCDVKHFPKPEKGGVINFFSNRLPDIAALVVVLRHCDHPTAKSAKNYGKMFHIPVLSKVSNWSYVADIAKGRKDLQWFWQLWERRNGQQQQPEPEQPKKECAKHYKRWTTEAVMVLLQHGPMTTKDLQKIYPVGKRAASILRDAQRAYPAIIDRQPTGKNGGPVPKWRYFIKSDHILHAYDVLKQERQPPFTFQRAIDAQPSLTVDLPPKANEPSQPKQPKLASTILDTVSRIRCDLDLLETAALELNQQLEAADNEVSDLEGMREILEDMIEKRKTKA